VTDAPGYEVAVVGGGPAGLTTALYTTRLGHRTALVNREGGRYVTVRHVHNLVGVSEEASGADVSERAIEQVTTYGGDYYEDTAESVERTPDADRAFAVRATRADLRADRVVLATGFADEPPRVPGLREFTGRGLHYCLHCDAYTLGDQPVFVLGHDDHAATVAMIMLNFTDDVDLLLDGEDPEWSDGVASQIEAHPVSAVEHEVDHAFAADDDRVREATRAPTQAGTPADPETADDGGERWLGGFEFVDGSVETYAGGFAVYGRRYNADLADALGCERNDDGSVAVNDSFETSVDGVYAVGDLTHGQNQTPVAMGDGARTGIAVHKDLRTFPVPADELDAVLDAPAAPPDLRARMRVLQGAESFPGLAPDD
jgi:thioredoxin reductase (NADPH)